MPQRVLLAHEISDEPADRVGPFRHIRLSREELRLAVEQEVRERGSATLTLDDGYSANIDAVIELIEQHGIDLILFLTTGFIDGSSVPYELQLAELLKDTDQGNYETIRRSLRGASDRARRSGVEKVASDMGREVPSFAPGRFLSWDEIRELDTHPLVSIGAHSVNHPLLPRRSPRAAWREILESKKVIESQIGHEIECFAYPYGATSPLVTSLVKFAGFSCAYVTGKGAPSGFRIGRVDLNDAA